MRILLRIIGIVLGALSLPLGGFAALLGLFSVSYSIACIDYSADSPVTSHCDMQGPYIHEPFFVVAIAIGVLAIAALVAAIVLAVRLHRTRPIATPEPARTPDFAELP